MWDLYNMRTFALSLRVDLQSLQIFEYTEFGRVFHSRGCKTIMDWLRVYNEADVIPFIEAVNKTRQQYYHNKIDMLEDAVSILGISITFVLNKALKMKKPGDLELCAPGQPCMQALMWLYTSWNRL